MSKIIFCAVVVPAVVALAAAGADRAGRARRARAKRPAVAVPPGVRNETFTYKKAPQAELALHVSFPKGWKASDKRPGIVFFFGGGWQGGTVGQFESQAYYLASRGMVAARADYRVKSRHRVKPDKCVEDARTAMRWVRANAAKLGIDPDRICASGGSAGGHLAICTALAEGVDDKADDLKVSCKPNLLVLYNPVLDMARMAGRVGGEEAARRISPEHRVTKDVPPAIMYYGSKDHFFEEAKGYLKKAAELKLPADVWVAEGMGHGFFNRPPWLPRTTHLTDRFLARHGWLTGESTVKLPEDKVGMTKYEAAAGK